MLHELDKTTREFIENEARKLQKVLRIHNGPNVYDYYSINGFFKSLKWRFQFNVKLNKTTNAMKGTLIEDSLEQIIKYNVINSDDSKTLQFDISSPGNLNNKFEYMMFLRAIFYEYWGEIKKNTEYKKMKFSDNSDYSLFSRAMIIPYSEFVRDSLATSNFTEGFKICDIADKFYVFYGVIKDRINDWGYIAN